MRLEQVSVLTLNFDTERCGTTVGSKYIFYKKVIFYDYSFQYSITYVKELHRELVATPPAPSYIVHWETGHDVIFVVDLSSFDLSITPNFARNI